MDIRLLICILFLINFILCLFIFREELHFTFKDILLFGIISSIIALLLTFYLEISTEIGFLVVATFLGIYLFIRIRALLISTIIFLFFISIIEIVWAGFTDTSIVFFNFDPYLSPNHPYPILFALLECLILGVTLYIIKTIARKHALFELIFSINKKLPFITIYIIASYYITYLAHLYAFSKSFLVFVNIIILIYLLTVCLFVYHLLSENYQKKQLLLLNDRLQTEQFYIDNAHSFKHDFKGLLLSLTTYIEQNKKAEALELLSSITDYSNELLTDSSYDMINNIQPIPIQSILVEKIKKINALKIKYSLTIDERIYISSMAPLDFIRCLDIIINNAIEASQNADKPQIKISISQSTSSIVLTVENTFNSDEKLNLSQISKKHFSNKTDHQGLGLYNLGKITNKYTNATYSIGTKDTFFVLTLAIDLV
ncbi:GHKL domain-containing protein [Listeria monocytogenes]|uniref:GHKL domain-containing protein n=1 Tax=Listeria monocytogenes TaxID=1639 RepID=UPI0011EB7527|nr:GHKL domain-containing protein [Listeria monocytogenes]TYV30958.1 GHKL domain-containing protein [Listeria monocytogenes]